MANHFSPAQSGLCCPPFTINFVDVPVFSPVYANVLHEGWNPFFDNDFENNSAPFPDNGEVCNGDFWQKQAGGEPVTWILFLGCGILSDDSRFGYTPLEEWHNYIEDGHADVICGYRLKGVGNPELVDFIGTEFSNIIKEDEPVYPELYIGEPPHGYNSRPIRAWMEANCWALNTITLFPAIHIKLSPDDRRDCGSARALVSDGMWVLENISETEKPVYRIFRIYF
jgi:hypothetical protein